MTEVLIGVGALVGFCVLTFGTAWLMAAWMAGTPRSRRREGRGRK